MKELLTKKLGFLMVLMLTGHLYANPPQGKRPTEFPNLSLIKDSTLLFTQDSVVHQSYKFTVGSLKDYMYSGHICLDSTFKNKGVLAPPIQTKESDSTYYTNRMGEIFNSPGIFFCNADSIFPDLSDKIKDIDSLWFNYDSSMYCSSGYAGGYEFTEHFPSNVKICPGGYIDKVVVEAHITNFHTDGSCGDTSDCGGALLMVKIDGEYVNPDNSILETDIPGGIIVGTYGPYTNTQFINGANRDSIDSLEVTFVWTGTVNFLLNGIDVTYYIKGCSDASNIVLSTDSNGCLILDTLDMNMDSYYLATTNGLTMVDPNTIRLGGTLNQNTTIQGANYNFSMDNLSKFSVHSYNNSDNPIDINGYSHYSSNTAIQLTGQNDSAIGIRLNGSTYSISNQPAVSIEGQNNGNGNGVKIYGAAIDSSKADIYLDPLYGRVKFANIPSADTLTYLYGMDSSGYLVKSNVGLANNTLYTNNGELLSDRIVNLNGHSISIGDSAHNYLREFSIDSSAVYIITGDTLTKNYSNIFLDSSSCGLMSMNGSDSTLCWSLINSANKFLALGVFHSADIEHRASMFYIKKDSVYISVTDTSNGTGLLITPKYQEFQNLPTDNSASKLLAQDTLGHNVWREATTVSYGDIKTVNSDYTVLLNDNTILADASGDTVNITLGAADSSTIRREYTFKKKDSSSNTVIITSASNIDGSTSYTLSSQYKFVIVKSDGSQWWIVGSN